MAGPLGFEPRTSGFGGLRIVFSALIHTIVALSVFVASILGVMLARLRARLFMWGYVFLRSTAGVAGVEFSVG